jgi:Mrp family chromosome partitioning ATPase
VITISHNSDGVLFCIASNQTNRDRAQDAITQLQRAKINVLGSVLTMVQSDRSGYYNYYYRYSKAGKKPSTLGQKLKSQHKKNLK